MRARRAVLVVIAALALAGAGAPPEPPAHFARYIENGRVQPGDYAWVEGSFADAPAEKKAQFEAIQRWADDCLAAARAQARNGLAAAGYPAANLDGVDIGPLACRQAKIYPREPGLTSFARLQQEMALARPVAESFLMAVRLAAELGNQGGGDFAHSLGARFQLDQMLGRAESWGDGAAGAGFPPLPPSARAIVMARIVTAFMAQTEAETDWLKAAIAKDGWPTQSAHGGLVPMQAWLLAQHADHDPLFQLTVLRLMEPLAARGEVSKSNYAYLYDRVMLKLAGKQRYGTQYHCVEGQRRPLPLEDEQTVDRLRREAGMDTLAQNIASGDRVFGPCQTNAS